jgi:uroporphyrinogen decarboxylase
MNSFEITDIFKKEKKPDFENILAVLRGEIPARPTLFEFAINVQLCDKLAGNDLPVAADDELQPFLTNVYAFQNAGYDYCTILLPDFAFPTAAIDQQETKSLNQGALIWDRESFETYHWPDPEQVDYSLLDRLAPYLPEGMKLIVFSPDGVLENAIKIIGFDALCLMLYEQPDLIRDVFYEIGSRLLIYYQNCIRYDIIGAVFGNDDWGFKNQTMLSPDHLRQFVFPWYRQIVATAHRAGKPAILHSCGKIDAVMNDVIDDMQFDGKHSFEDNIQPVEAAYQQYHDRIAIFGGIDVDFICRSSPEQIYERSKRMVETSRQTGRYALGTGNSVPVYVLEIKYFSMIQAVIEER